MQHGGQAGDEKARPASAEVGRALPGGTESLRADLVRDHVQERSSRDRGRDLEERAFAEAGHDAAEEHAGHAGRAHRRRAERHRSRPAQLEERQHDRGGERRVMGDQRDLQIELTLRLRQRRHQREAFRDGVEDERGKPDFGRHAQAGESASVQEPRTEGARARLQCPRQREAGRHPQERGQPLRGQHFGQQMEGDDSRRGREGERARALEDRRPLARDQRDAAAEQRGKCGQQRGADHRQLSQRPRSSSRWPRTR